MEVIADGGEHGVDGVAGAVSEVATTPAVLGLEMTDHWPNQQRLWNLYSGMPDKF